MDDNSSKWKIISFWSRMILTFVITILMIDDWMSFSEAARPPEVIGIFSLAYLAVIITAWIPSWSWVVVSIVLLSSIITSILGPTLFTVIAAGYALAMIGAWRHSILLGLGTLGTVFVGMVLGLFPRTIWWIIPIAFLVSLGLGAVIAMVRDSAIRLSERTQALSATEDEIRWQERVRIATDLHDGLGQSLALISLTASAAEEANSVDELQKALSETVLIAQEAREQMHQLAEALAPLWRSDCMDDAGIPIPSRVLASVSKKLGSARWRVIASDGAELDQLPPAARDLCCRVLQEGTTNILRHAAPGLIEISICQAAVSTHLAITSPLPRAEQTIRNTSGGRGLTLLAQAATGQGAKVSAGPSDGRWNLELVLGANWAHHS